LKINRTPLELAEAYAQDLSRKRPDLKIKTAASEKSASSDEGLLSGKSTYTRQCATVRADRIGFDKPLVEIMEHWGNGGFNPNAYDVFATPDVLATIAESSKKLESRLGVSIELTRLDAGTTPW
jgi:hypothetical protein